MTAIPVKVQEEESLCRPNYLNRNNKNIIDISSDSDLSIERVYNPLTGEITENFTTDLNHNDVKIPETKLLTHPGNYKSPEKVKSPTEMTYKEFVTGKNAEENLVPSKIQKYEEINGCIKQLSQSSPNLTSTPTPAPRNFHFQRIHDEQKVYFQYELHKYILYNF